MPQTIYYLSSPEDQLLNRLVNTFQVERFNREREEHFQGVEDEAADKKLTGLIGGAVLGGVGAFALGGTAAVAATATTAATAATSASLATVASGVALGARSGTQIAGGDIAGGVATAAGGIAQGVQAKADRDAFGFNPTEADRKTLEAIAKKQGKLPTQVIQDAKNAGLTIPQHLQQVQTNAATAAEIKDMADELNVSQEFLKQESLLDGGNLQATAERIQEVNAANEARFAGMKTLQQSLARSDAGRIAWSRKANLEAKPGHKELNIWKNLDDQQADARQARRDGVIPTDEALAAKLDELEDAKTIIAKETGLRAREAPWSEKAGPSMGTEIIKTPSGNLLGVNVTQETSDGDGRPVKQYDADDIAKADRIARRQRGGPGGGLGDVFEEAGSLRSMDAFNKAATTLAIMKGGDRPTNKEVFDFMREQQSGIQAEMSGAAPVADVVDKPVVAPAGDQVQPAPPVAPVAGVPPEVSLIHQKLNEEISVAPISSWSPAKIEVADTQTNKAIGVIMQGPRTPETIKIAKDLLEIKRQVDNANTVANS